MSEIRLITEEELSNFACEVMRWTEYERAFEAAEKEVDFFNRLPKPTLPDITGTRTLDSMTEDEIRELVELYAGSSVYIKRVLRDNDKSIYVEYVECSKRKTMHIYLGELSVGDKEVKIFKWFIEKGFNVFGETK